MLTEFTFNSGTTLPYNIEIKEISGNTSATISITYR